MKTIYTLTGFYFTLYDTVIITGEPDNWSSGTAIYVLIHGLAGMQDREVAFQSPLVAPRWTTKTAKNAASDYYPASVGYFAYQYE